ncbi:MAG: serine/threonine-protein kinase [Proteobacteria bacterium]|nr:serine/threonine-protein kinase [Cystobacterineae bacterium]MCL2259609.1 serine/threonine-protein kinase [Cystobacterineae bacterium]MCL2314874.1 serine/threonine-protein kinase [Pseudomonadota bacterium]
MIGEVISGKFRLERAIAKGGMGVVYEGTHLHLKRKVALKILHAHLVRKDNSMERFRREAIVLAKLDHPHAVRIYDFGIHQGMPYIAMEFIDGIELADVLAIQGFLSLPRIVHMAEQILDVLSSAHKLGIIHRDLKPANIMLCNTEQNKTDSKEDFVRVVDFGIAFLRDQDEPRMTQQGHVHGTAAYMSPEQCRGLDIDARSDLYSLGCVIYELISGQPPFVSDGSIETLSAHLYREPASLRQTFPEREVPVAMEAFVMRALAKQRSARFPSADAMRQELIRAYKESGLKTARPPRTLLPNQVAEWWVSDTDAPPVALLELNMDAASRDILLTTLGVAAVKSVRIEPGDSLLGYGLVMVLAQDGQQGLAVCEKLLATPQTPPIVLCGPEDDLELMTTAIGVGVHDYIPLPLDPTDVARKVVRILRRYTKLSSADA